MYRSIYMLLFPDESKEMKSGMHIDNSVMHIDNSEMHIDNSQMHIDNS